VQPSVVFRQRCLGQQCALPVPADAQVQQPVAVEVGDLHAGVSVADQIGLFVRDGHAGGEDRRRASSDVAEPVYGSRLTAGEKIEVAVGVDIRNVKPGVAEVDVSAVRLDGDRVRQPGCAAGVRPQVAVEPAVVVAAHEHVVAAVAIAVPILHEGD